MIESTFKRIENLIKTETIVLGFNGTSDYQPQIS